VSKKSQKCLSLSNRLNENSLIEMTHKPDRS